ncbi:unnamed protein product [Calypogeia fissa]
MKEVQEGLVLNGFVTIYQRSEEFSLICLGLNRSVIQRMKLWSTTLIFLIRPLFLLPHHLKKSGWPLTCNEYAF